MRWFSVCLGIFSLLVSVSLPTRAAQEMQRPFHAIAVINRMDLSEKIMVMHDQTFLFPATTPVYVYDPTLQDPDALRAPKQRRSASSLRPGMRVGYNVERPGQRQVGRITEVWLLPPGIKAPGEKER